MTQPEVGYAVKRGEQCVEKNNYRLRKTGCLIMPVPHNLPQDGVEWPEPKFEDNGDGTVAGHSRKQRALEISPNSASEKQ